MLAVCRRLYLFLLWDRVGIFAFYEARRRNNIGGPYKFGIC